MTNRRYEDLSRKEQNTVFTHYKQCMEDETMECRKQHRNVQEFWEAHKEQDYPNWTDKPEENLTKPI